MHFRWRCVIQRFSKFTCLYFHDFVAFMFFLHAFSCYAISLEVWLVFHVSLLHIYMHFRWRCVIQRFSKFMCLYFHDLVAFMSFLHAFSCYAISLEVWRIFHVVINLFLLLVLCCFLMPSWWPKIVVLVSRSKAICKINYSREFSKSRIMDSMLGSLGLLSTPKASSRGEAFPHTYKVTTSPFHNQCEITPIISPSHIGPWLRATTTCFFCELLGRDLLVNLGSDTSVGWSWVSLNPKS